MHISVGKIKTLKLLAFIFISLTAFQGIVYGESSEKARMNRPILTCVEVKARTNIMLEYHYAYSDFTDRLSELTYKKYFDILDPSKMYFYKYDIENFSWMKNSLNKMIEQNNCTFIFDIYDLFVKRVKERTEKAKYIINNSNLIFEKDTISMEKLNWARNPSEINKRLIKKIKLQYLLMYELDKDRKKVINKLNKNYGRIEKKVSSLDSDKIYSYFLNSFAFALDPHSTHMLPVEHDSFIIHISNKLEGIGAQLHESDSYVSIDSLVPGGVAQKDGRLKPNDKIIAVDAGNGAGIQDLFNAEVEQVANLIRGPKGSIVKLFILRKTKDGIEKFSISLVRDEIDLKEDNVKNEIINVEGKKIGIIKISSFYTDLRCKSYIFVACQGVAYDVERQLKTLTQNGVNGILLDLRNNGGGDFPESIKLTSLFIPSGTVVQTKDKNKLVKTQKMSNSGWVYKGPLVVLINRYSASASEIFAGAIQDYGRGIIVGDDRTYGKATVQVVQEIPGSNGRRSDGAIKVTQSKFYRVSGSSNQKYGVRSDIDIPSLLEVLEIGEENLDFAFEQDSIKPAKGFKPLQNLEGIIANLRELSKKRISKNKKFRSLFQKEERIRVAKNKEVPLNKEYLEIYELQENPKVQTIHENNKANLVKDDDIQMNEALLISSDSITLTGSDFHWAGANE